MNILFFFFFVFGRRNVLTHEVCWGISLPPTTKQLSFALNLSQELFNTLFQAGAAYGESLPRCNTYLTPRPPGLPTFWGGRSERRFWKSEGMLVIHCSNSPHPFLFKVIIGVTESVVWFVTVQTLLGRVLLHSYEGTKESTHVHSEIGSSNNPPLHDVSLPRTDVLIRPSCPATSILLFPNLLPQT